MRRWYCYTKWESRLPPPLKPRAKKSLGLFLCPVGASKLAAAASCIDQGLPPPDPRVASQRPAEAGFYRAILPARPPLAPVGAVVIGLVIGNKMPKRALTVPKWYREQKTVVLLPFSSKSSKWEQNPPFLLPLLVLRDLLSARRTKTGARGGLEAIRHHTRSLMGGYSCLSGRMIIFGITFVSAKCIFKSYGYETGTLNVDCYVIIIAMPWRFA